MKLIFEILCRVVEGAELDGVEDVWQFLGCSITFSGREFDENDTPVFRELKRRPSGNGVAKSDATLDSGGPPLVTRSDGNPCAIGLDGTGAVAELPSTSQRLPDCTECWLDAGRHRCPSCGKRPLCGSCLRRHACFPEIDTIASGERKVMCSRASAPQHLGEAGKVLPPECLTVNKGERNVESASVLWAAPPS